VTDVTGVSGCPVEQPAVEHDAAADAGRDHHPDEVTLALRRADPPFAQGKRFGIVVDVDVEAAQCAQPLPERERAPRRDVQGRDELTAGRHRSAAANAHHVGALALRHRQGIDQRHQRGPQLLAVSGRRRGCLDARGERSSGVDQPHRQLGAANVDREGGPHGRTT
jgi:hypothetical protein